MSESVSNLEIEDVVSSIRRLFSEDKRRADVVPEIPEKQGVSAAINEEALDDRLVLTPAFRVEHSGANDALEAIDPELESTALILPSADDSVDNSADEALDAPILGASAESDAESADEAKKDLDVLVLGAWQSAAVVEAPKPDASVTQTDPVIAASQSRQSTLLSTIAELEAAISDQGTDFEPDGSEEIGSIPENEPLQWQDADAAAQEVATPKPEEAKEEVIELDNAAPQNVNAAFVRRHAAPPEDDGLHEPSFIAAAAAAQDATPDAILEAPSFEAASDLSAEPQPEEPQPEELTAALERDEIDVNDLALDEDALRDLVSEIVRQELQGALGERITRNVRKLVRREIHRIISSHEFD